MKVNICKPPNNYYAKQKCVFIDNNTNLVHKYFPRTSDNIIKFWNEVTCLTILRKNFINNQNICHYPFPIIQEYCEKHFYITTNFCGITAKDNKNITPIKLKDTVECIIDNLKYNFIIYKDIHPNNICIDTNGYIYLVDFDVAFLFFYKKYKPRVGSHRYTLEKFNNFYVKPNNIKDYNNLDINVLSHWKSKPWSILYMFNHLKFFGQNFL